MFVFMGSVPEVQEGQYRNINGDSLFENIVISNYHSNTSNYTLMKKELILLISEKV